MFYWVLETDLKGWLPRSVVDSTLAHVMAQQLLSLRVHVSDVKDHAARIVAENARLLELQQRRLARPTSGRDHHDDRLLNVVVMNPSSSSLSEDYIPRSSTDDDVRTVAQSLPHPHYNTDHPPFMDCIDRDDHIVS